MHKIKRFFVVIGEMIVQVVRNIHYRRTEKAPKVESVDENVAARYRANDE